jgi:fatty-acyl-CoA synthase
LLLESEDGNSLTHDGVSQGELIVRTPWCTQGYFNEPEKSEELWKDGFLHTNDVAVIDPDGYVQIKDRLKDVIKTGGEWVSSLLLESLLSRNPAVLESAVVGKYDERWGERPVALVVLQESRKGELTQNDLKDFLMQFVEEGLISKWSVPDEFIFVDSVPKTSVGKINKKLIRAEL